MSKTEDSIVIGFEIGSGEEVSIPVKHTFVSGMTETGKSETIRAMIERSEQRVLCLDVKSQRDYPNINDIPLYIEQAMDPTTLRELLESVGKMGLTREFPDLIRLCSQSKDWDDLLTRIRTKMDREKIHPIVANNLTVLAELLTKLLEEFRRYKFSDRVELTGKVNVMDLSTIDRALQQVIVASTTKYVLSNLDNVTIVIDEAHRFIPQAATSIARTELTTLIKEGRARGDYVWLADQTVTGITKDALKSIYTWILGRQPEINEAKRTVEQIPQRKDLGLTAEAIQTLGLGEFIVVTRKWAKRVYVWPTWIPRGNAIQVAKGEMSSEQVARKYATKGKKGDDEEMWEEKYKELRREHDALKRQYEELKTKHTQLAEKLDKLMTAKAIPKANTPRLDTPRVEKPSPKPALKPDENTTVVTIPESLTVTIEQPQLTIVKRTPPLELTDEDLIGKIAMLYANGELPADKWFTTGTVRVLFQSHAWQEDPKSYEALDQMTKWGYFKKQYSGRRPEWRIVLLHEEAEDKGLLRTKED